MEILKCMISVQLSDRFLKWILSISQSTIQSATLTESSLSSGKSASRNAAVQLKRVTAISTIRRTLVMSAC